MENTTSQKIPCKRNMTQSLLNWNFKCWSKFWNCLWKYKYEEYKLRVQIRIFGIMTRNSLQYFPKSLQVFFRFSDFWLIALFIKVSIILEQNMILTWTLYQRHIKRKKKCIYIHIYAYIYLLNKINTRTINLLLHDSTFMNHR